MVAATAAEVTARLLAGLSICLSIVCVASSPPAVSVVIVSYNRPHFLRRAIFNAESSLCEFSLLTGPQSKNEIIVVEDSDPGLRLPQSVIEMLANGSSDCANLRRIVLPMRTPTGAKRNIAVSQATGQIVMHWDDDDIYPAQRIESQVRPILQNIADVTVLEYSGWLVLTPDYRGTATLLSNVTGLRRCWGHWGTLAWRRTIWSRAGVRFPATYRNEDFFFVQTAMLRIQPAMRLKVVVAKANRRIAMHIRHGSNMWSFEHRKYPRLFQVPWTHVMSSENFHIYNNRSLLQLRDVPLEDYQHTAEARVRREIDWGVDLRPLRSDGCYMQHSNPNPTQWLRRNAGAPWSMRHMHRMVALHPRHGGHLLVLAGGFAGSPLSDVWRSRDGGRNWTRASDAAPWGPRTGFSMAAIGAGQVALWGGIRDGTAPVDLWMGMDAGSRWTRLSRSTCMPGLTSPVMLHLPRRLRLGMRLAGFNLAVVGGHRMDGVESIKIWVGHAVPGYGCWRVLRDVLEWRGLHISAGAVMPRATHGPLVFVAGIRTEASGLGAANELWRSSDMRHWVRVISSARVWGAAPVSHFSMLSAGRALFVLAGSVGGTAQKGSFCSMDEGRRWSLLGQSPWKGRWNAAATVVRKANDSGRGGQSLILAGGFSGWRVRHADVWEMPDAELMCSSLFSE